MSNITPAAEHLSQALRFKTVSHDDISKMDLSQFSAFETFLEETYPLLHEKLKKMKINNHGLVFRWRGKNSDRRVLMTAHYDEMCIRDRFYIVGKFWFIFNPTNKMALYVNAAGVAVGVAISFVMFNTNRNNIVDLIEAKEGHRLDSMVSTVDNLASKLAQSLVTWLIGFSLARAGYNAELSTQPPAVITTLNVLLGVVPMIFGIAMFFVVRGFKIEEEIKELNEKRMKLSS